MYEKIDARSLRRLNPRNPFPTWCRSPDSERNHPRISQVYKVGSRKTYRHVCCSVRSFLARWIVSKRISNRGLSKVWAKWCTRSWRAGSMRLMWCDQCWEQEEREWTPREVVSVCDIEERVGKSTAWEE